MKRKSITVMAIVLASLFLPFPARALAATTNDVASQLICQCGCTAVLSNCTHSECMVRDTMTSLIGQKLDQGQSPQQIIQFFTSQYGEQVLASPTKKGFNLMAWLLPFIAIGVGGLVIYIVMKKWVLKGKETEVAAVASRPGESDEYWDRVERELADFSERSFR